MAPDLSTLDDEQAQRVLVEVFELLPSAGKPGYDELASLVDDVRDGAAAELRGPLTHLDDSAELRGALARRALQALAAQPGGEPLVVQALARASRPHMMALPALVAGVVLLLSVVPTQFRRDADGSVTVEWNQLQNLAAVLEQLSEIVKALPKPLLDKLA